MIRLATPNDLEALMRIENECFSNEKFSPVLYLFYIYNEESEVYVYQLGPHTIGSLVLSFSSEDNVCHIVSVAISTSFQGQGFGTDLVRFSLKKAAEKGSLIVQLEVRISNIPARKLYESLGFRQIQVMRNFYGAGEDGILYIKNLQ